MNEGGIRGDNKSMLQEMIQANLHLTPTYRVIETTGPDHDRRFTVEVLAADTVLGRGSGRSKKVAEAEAARSALEKIQAGSEEARRSRKRPFTLNTGKEDLVK